MHGRRGVGSWAGVLLVAAWGCGGTSSDRGGAPEVTRTQDAGRGVVFVGFDGSPPLVTALEQGKLQGLVLQNPYRMGQLGVKTLVDALEKKEVPREIATGEAMATPENMKAPEIAALLNPPKEQHSSNASLTGS